MHLGLSIYRLGHVVAQNIERTRGISLLFLVFLCAIQTGSRTLTGSGPCWTIGRSLTFGTGSGARSLPLRGPGDRRPWLQAQRAHGQARISPPLLRQILIGL